ncbi:hypothetical protein, partial [Sphingomonas oligophenolica]|uniref:hypothetical protein n=1 Tax=Sphingomonas oligophenolica TaxID=301154 RepID=UPI0031E3C118
RRDRRTLILIVARLSSRSSRYTLPKRQSLRYRQKQFKLLPFLLWIDPKQIGLKTTSEVDRIVGKLHERPTNLSSRTLPFCTGQPHRSHDCEQGGYRAQRTSDHLRPLRGNVVHQSKIPGLRVQSTSRIDRIDGVPKVGISLLRRNRSYGDTCNNLSIDRS